MCNFYAVICTRIIYSLAMSLIIQCATSSICISSFVSYCTCSVNTSTSISLLGKNYTRFGEIFNENILHLLENFANGTAPSNPTEGQLWYDTNVSILKLYDNGVWYQIGSPAGTTQVQIRRRQDTLGVYHKTIEHIVDANIVTIMTDDTTAWTPHATEYLEDGVTALSTQFPTIQAGTTMNNTTNYKFRGIATSAEYADLAERYEADAEYEAGTVVKMGGEKEITQTCHLYTSPSPRDLSTSRMPSSA